ncbi:transcriptional regulator [Prescottella equi]|uniref:helix-turn-helix transcriptional regulator n=1 Tax=Rhodococcus hoagii TaxID=43767 RepID=UPI0009BF47FC|nr:helix-turn-helix transcriptional regulator [Prescottella equi]NKS87332.1 helix-turn-helix domain-containing protein [Prescottella equi]NKZ79369.1 helix-turn-helix domain-containing protein [Prescottella equi]OQQ25869.1 transcriptional regulator [Prescottella equi]
MSENPRENRVREHRKAVGITQAELARAGGVSRQSIVSVEGGDYAPSVYLALRLAAALGTTVEALFPLNEEG